MPPDTPQAQQHKPHLFALRRDPLRRAPAEQLWPKGVAACSHAEWVGSCALAERKASRWRKKPVCRGHRDP